ncbi:M20 metallopeptidase family protein [Novosphingobium album (ex Liu et al. 2023)]|uniref:M20 family metallopeptidase n=1 Tax=Novosphingobium album (ex Liu et al. 2023) TaxID=3031130 RepID=A0ABT5WV64_9SPHN|nr:M20 family metallopeptidase [Novosphingobium album (ex Liu et al. 2023)]MDE8653744.1 M20 family metallopeptidase [Novosphingobium album (ex Liu et al. 2023)]
MLHEALIAQARDIADRITGLRRAIHAEPELGLHTPKTRDKVRAALAHLPLTWREGPSTTGLVATLAGEGGEGASVLLRGDMDALPMPEETGLAFASTIPGVMHACGHDAHVAMLAGAAELLCARRATLKGEVRFMFQPGEEGHHGARFMLRDGLLDPLPDAAFALHVMPNAPHGLVGGRAGPLLAAADQIEIMVSGRGGHASMPHDTLDPVPVACEIVSAIQTMVARRYSVFDPVVVTIAKIASGTAHNVIPDSARMTGTMRTLSAASRARLKDELPLLAAGIAGAHGLSAETTIMEGFPVTVCDARAVDFGEAVARDMFGDQAFLRLADPIMGAEDFAYVLEKLPGAMFFLGVSHQGDDWRQCCGIHSTRMMVDETVMPMGAAYLAGLAESYLARGFAPNLQG